MDKAASNLEFEEAAKIRDEIKKLKQKDLGLILIPKWDNKINSNLSTEFGVIIKIQLKRYLNDKR